MNYAFQRDSFARVTPSSASFLTWHVVRLIVDGQVKNNHKQYTQDRSHNK